MAAWVYVVSDRRGHVKVGMSEDVASRLAGLQGANPLPLVLEMTVGPMERDEAHRLESRTHAILERCRTSGKWFSCGTDEAAEAVRQARLEIGIECEECGPATVEPAMCFLTDGDRPLEWEDGIETVPDLDAWMSS